LLGLDDRGHLGPGALADVAVYEDLADRTAMFRAARLVFKNGELVVRDGAVVNPRMGRTLSVRPPVDPAMKRRLSDYVETTYGHPAEILDVRDSAVASVTGAEHVFEAVPCRS
jgi:formylmethanofuran dehydrogenase subunit A